MKKQSVQDIANELLEVRLQKAELATKDKLLSAALREHSDFKKQDTFKLVPVLSLKVNDAEKAMAWAKKDAPFLVKVDTAQALRYFRQHLEDQPEKHGMVVELADQLRVAREDKHDDIA